MADHMEVRPRFQEPDAPRVPEPVHAAPQAADAAQMAIPAAGGNQSTTRGLFTSVYENKIIVLIIVVAIIIIGIIAYVIYRKPEEDPDKSGAKSNNGQNAQPTQSVQSTQPDQSVQSAQSVQSVQSVQSTQQPVQSAQSAQPVQSTQQKGTQSKPVVRNKNDLLNLLERSKNNETKKAPQQQVPRNMKSEDEIMQLMEDENIDESENHENSGELADETVHENETAHDSARETTHGTMHDSTHETMHENDNETDPECMTAPIQETLTPHVNNATGICTAILPTKRTCRNKAKSKGKCHLHGG